MKKIIYFSVLLSLITGCNLEDFNESTLPLDNPLLLRKTTREGPDVSRETNFDDEGRILKIENNNSGYFYDYSYEEDIDKISVYTYGRIETSSYRFNYNNSELTSFNFGFMGGGDDYIITRSENLTSFNYESNNELYTYTVVFETNQLSKVIGLHTFNNFQNKYLSKTNLFYDSDGNLIEVIREIQNYEEINSSIKFTYDHRTNPLHNSMSKYAPELLMSGNGYGIIINSSPNNLTSNDESYENYLYEYHNNYPISSEKTIKGDNLIIETKTYFYH